MLAGVGEEMKLSKTEMAVAGLTIAFFAFVGGYFLGQSSMGQTVSIRTEFPTPSEEAAVETTAPASAEPDATPTSRKININTASRTELETLPGIGEVLAERIIDYRQNVGKFRTIYDITNVKGIGEKTLAEMEEFITVE